MRCPPGVERLRAFEVAEEADAGRARAELGVERALDRVAEGLRVERRVRGRSEAKPFRTVNVYVRRSADSVGIAAATSGTSCWPRGGGASG